MSAFRVIIANKKGGVGKTTYTWLISVCLARDLDLVVLCVDTDINQLDLGRLMLDVDTTDKIKIGEIYHSRYEGIDYVALEKIQDIGEMKVKDNYDVIMVDTHPNVYSPVVVEEGDFLIVPLEGSSSIENAKELITEDLKKRAQKILCVLNKTTQSQKVGVKEIRLARNIGVELYPYPVRFVSLMRRAILEKRPVWEFDKRTSIYDVILDIAVMISMNTGKEIKCQ